MMRLKDNRHSWFTEIRATVKRATEKKRQPVKWAMENWATKK